MNDWVGDLQRLALQPDSITVVHSPMTPRYWRAQTVLSMIIQNGEAIGYRKVPSSNSEMIFEVAVWAENEDAGFFDQESGYYSVFRMEYWENEGELIAEYAELFCFYDGRDPKGDDPKNPKLLSKNDAIKYMQIKFPEYEVIHI